MFAQKKLQAVKPVMKTSNPFHELQQVEKVVQQRQAKQVVKFEQEMQAARYCLNKFNQSANCPKHYLQEAVEHLLAATKLQRSRFEPYVLLAYAMASAKAFSLFAQYLKIARELGAPQEILSLFSQHNGSKLNLTSGSEDFALLNL